MTVLLADRWLGVRRRATGPLDPHGDAYRGGWGSLQGPHPGRAAEGPDVPEGQPQGRTWRIALDPRLWPVAQGDLVADPGSGEQWLVTSADLLTNNAAPDVDYIAVEAHLRTPTGTRP